MIFEGELSSDILIISDFQRIDCAAEHKPLSERLKTPLKSAYKSAGIRDAQVSYVSIHGCPAGGKDLYRIPAEQRKEDLAQFKALVAKHGAKVLVPLGEYCLETVTGLSGIQKWHCNIVKSKAEYEGRKSIPLYHPEYVYKSFGDSAYLAFGFMRIKQEMVTSLIPEHKRNFVLGPTYQETIKYLDEKVSKAEVLSVDIETGGGLINTVGFATSGTDAIAIKTLPEFYSPDDYLALWKAIARILEGPQPKVLQNFIYEATWFARYGIELNNVTHDTMWAMKFLHPEFEKGLDNVGRLYTDFPYWKDDNDDWANIRDWHRHLDYNCKDTTGTFVGYERQKQALASRGLDSLFSGYVMRFAPVITEMCVNGLKLDTEALVNFKANLEREKENQMRILGQEFSQRIGREVNPRSNQQLRAALKDLGLKLPTKTDRKTGKSGETTDKKALVKLRKKYPDEPVLPALIGLSSTNKQLSSYVDFNYDRRTERVHYSLDGCGTETGRWAGYNSGWGEGFNPQTVPKKVRNLFVPDDGKRFIQIDLKSAESFYVAYESPEPILIQMLHEGRDVHKYVASKIFKKPEEIVNKLERQLGKKSGHSANYSVGPRTFAEACLVEMNYHIDEREARRILDMYFEVFPGIRRRQANIRNEVYNKRVLRTPIGRERYFYGRMDDATFREAYAYAPQSTIPDITNHLMLKLWDNREYLDVEFFLQCHDSILLQAPPDRVMEIVSLAHDLNSWHPKIILPGGELQIPVEVEVGDRWGKLEVISP